MNQDSAPTPTTDEIRQNLEALQKQEMRLNTRLTKLANLLRQYEALDESTDDEEYAEDRQVLLEEVNLTLDAIKGCSLYQAQLSQLLTDQADKV